MSFTLKYISYKNIKVDKYSISKFSLNKYLKINILISKFALNCKISRKAVLLNKNAHCVSHLYSL